MIIQSLTLSDFRNYDRCALEFDPGVNIICGPNAQGKTNLLEAAFVLTGLKSWRTAKKAELVAHTAPQAAIRAAVTARGRAFDIRIRISRQGRGGASVNDVPVRRQRDLSDVVRCVLFSPEDLGLVKQGAQARRAFLDTALCQLRPRYADALARYGRALEHKQRALRLLDQNPQMAEALPEYNAQLAAYGSELIGCRAAFIDALSREAARIHGEISGGRETLALSYQTVSAVCDPRAPRGEVESALLGHLHELAQAERQSRACLSGAHRDELVVRIDGRAARSFASQGQTRTAALALKLAERELFREDAGEYPVLLLDDVLSELDAARQAYVVRHTQGGQCLITCCDMPDRLGGGVIQVSGGKAARADAQG